MTPRHTASVLLTAVLTVVAISAGAQGWVVSRANCINNESITWQIRLVGVPGSFLGIPIGVSALRRTISTHHDHLTGLPPHDVESSSTLEDTWRSDAVHWFEGRPTLVGYPAPRYAR